MDKKSLQLTDIEHEYARRPALGPISLTLNQGEAVAIVGPSGCGKTTLLSIAAGLLVPTRGEVHNSFTNPTLMFQQARLLPWKNTLANISLGLKARGINKAQRHQAATELALKLGLATDDLTKYPAELSGGMQSRVALARALLPKPDLLFLDEAFSALDIGLKAELYRHLRTTMAELGTGLLMITHDPQEAMRLADKILVLEGNPGKLALEFAVGVCAACDLEPWLVARNQEFLALKAVQRAFEL